MVYYTKLGLIYGMNKNLLVRKTNIVNIYLVTKLHFMFIFPGSVLEDALVT